MITTWSGMIISVLGTLLMVALFIFELQAFLTVKATTSLVVDELIDEACLPEMGTILELM